MSRKHRTKVHLMNKKFKRIPVIRQFSRIGYRYIYRPLRAQFDRVTLLRLANSTDPQAREIFHALQKLKGYIPQNEINLIARIEEERERLLICDEPLVDNSQYEPGLYDKGKTVRSVCKASKSPKPLLLMYMLILAIKPSKIIELGTNLGISSAYLATALKLNGQNGRLITLEASPYRLRLAKQVHKNLGLKNITYIQGLFSETLSNILNDIGPVDFAFIDGHHQYQPTLDYFHKIWDYSIKKNMVFIFDDIRWSKGMKRAWSKIKADDRIGLSIDLVKIGICVGTQKPLYKKHRYQPLFSPLS